MAFQYPPSDRRCFNFARGLGLRGAHILSVSTIGSSLLQLRPPANRPHRESLSVSTIGSSLLQLKMVAYRPAASLIFQYPPSDRRCFNSVQNATKPRIELSVSTIGSSLLQRFRQSLPDATSRLSVSTIGSSLLQLKRFTCRDDIFILFQYPPSDRRCFNLYLPVRWI